MLQVVQIVDVTIFCVKTLNISGWHGSMHFSFLSFFFSSCAQVGFSDQNKSVVVLYFSFFIFSSSSLGSRSHFNRNWHLKYSSMKSIQSLFKGRALLSSNKR